jgi:hypothetical protein
MLDWLIEGGTGFARSRLARGGRLSVERPSRLVRFGPR